MATKKGKITYAEPSNYFPKYIRDEVEKEAKQSAKKTVAKKPAPKKTGTKKK